MVMKIKAIVAGTALAAALLAGTSAGAATVLWNTWTDSATIGATGGAASGTAGGIGVTYSGELENLFFDYPTWNPASTFSGGTVDNAPPAAGGIVQLFGGGQTVDTITFSAPVTDPVLAIWSLGQSGEPASFVFAPNETFAIESGGPSAEYGGTSITRDGNTVIGVEGNGTIQFFGTYSQISWTNPLFENWYGFAVGIDGAAAPEPAAWALMLAGFALLGAGVRSRRRMLASA